MRTAPSITHSAAQARHTPTGALRLHENVQRAVASTSRLVSDTADSAETEPLRANRPGTRESCALLVYLSSAPVGPISLPLRHAPDRKWRLEFNLGLLTEFTFVRYIDTISDMSMSTIAAIKQEFEQAEPGTPIPIARLLRHGTRAAVDQALTRMTRSGQIERAARGVYYRPRTSRLVGAVPPEPRSVVAAIAASRGERILTHGAEAARRFGLSTQTPLSPVFLTDGPNRSVRIGKTKVRLQHAPPREMALAGRPAGEALTALRYLGSEGANSEAITRIRAVLPEEEFEVLRGATTAMPSWLSDAFFHFEHPKPEKQRETALA